MPSKAWKSCERNIARITGGERMSSRNLGLDSADVVTPAFSYEVKERKELPQWILDAMAQSERNARDDRTAVVVLHQLGDRYDDSLVVLRLRDWVAWHEEPKIEQSLQD